MEKWLFYWALETTSEHLPPESETDSPTARPHTNSPGKTQLDGTRREGLPPRHRRTQSE